MPKKSKSRYFFKSLGILFLVFVSLIIAYESGYYETKAGNRATLTKDAMEKFEADLVKGEVVDINDYLKKDNIDYSNNVTKFGNKMSNAVSEVMTNGIQGIFNTLKGLFW